MSTPLTIMAPGGGGVVRWVRSDFVTTNAGRCTALLDQSGNGHNLSEVASSGPTYTTGLVDGRPGLVFNGSTHYLENTSYALPVPGTTPTWRWMVARLDTWVNARPFFCSVTGSHQETFFATSSPQFRNFNGTNGPLNATGLSVGAWRRIEMLYNNSTTDYLKAGSVNVTGTNTGNLGGTGGGSRLARDSASSFGAISFVEMVEMTREPSAGEKTALDAYGVGLYPSAGF